MQAVLCRMEPEIWGSRVSIWRGEQRTRELDQQTNDPFEHGDSRYLFCRRIESRMNPDYSSQYNTIQDNSLIDDSELFVHVPSRRSDVGDKSFTAELEHYVVIGMKLPVSSQLSSSNLIARGPYLAPYQNAIFNPQVDNGV